MIRPLPAALGLLAALLAAPAGASTMLGSTAGIVVSGAALTATPGTAVIGAGVEFHTALILPFLDIDIGSNAVTFTAVGPFRLGLARSIVLSGLAFTGPSAAISGIDVGIGAGITGISAANFSFTADTLRFDLTTATFQEGARIVVDLATTPPSGTVPEPGSLGLLLAGLLGLGLIGRRTAAS